MRLRAAELGRQLIAERTPKRGVPASDVDPRRRDDDGNLLHDRH